MIKLTKLPRYSQNWKCAVANIVESKDDYVSGRLFKISKSNLEALDTENQIKVFKLTGKDFVFMSGGSENPDFRWRNSNVASDPRSGRSLWVVQMNAMSLHRETTWDAARSALRQVVGEMNIDSILSTAKSNLVEKTKLLAQTSLDAWNAGIHIVGVQLLQADPPADVMEAFRDVASAREDRETYINKAYAYRDSTIPEARASPNNG